MVAVVEPRPGARGEDAPRRITILGSTGSIGCNTLDLVRRSNAWQVVALTAHRNVERLAAQAREFGAELAVVADPDAYGDLAEALAGTGTRAAAGKAAIIEASSLGADMVMAGIVGAAGIEATFAALAHAPSLAIANKECLVAAGALFAGEARRTGARLLPVDSEHSAIFQVLDQTNRQSVAKIILTASGGPFRTWSVDEMREASLADALAHPNWSMGAKISVDSATMMNKGLELIEAHHLFGVGADELQVLVHPQSIVHSLVAYHDGSVLAQLGEPDMRTPIAVALAWPRRMPAPVTPLDLAAIGTLTFEAADTEKFPALALALGALGAGGTAPIVLNAANEVAVEAFLAGRIGFLDIAATVAATLDAAGGRLGAGGIGSIEDVLECDRAGRHIACEVLAGRHRTQTRKGA
jgi:1-deoxy-D-xylulose-5-phosphate reductoisomerase